MTFIYITGSPGSGKTTIQKELTRRGHLAYDLDDYGGPHNKSTDKPAVMPPAGERSPEWFELHEWRINLGAIKELKSQAGDKEIFVCGVAASDEQILSLFDKVLYLSLTDELLRKRIAMRTMDNGDYGKNDFEVKEIINRKHGLDTKYLPSDAVKIDAIKTLDNVIVEILSNS